MFKDMNNAVLFLNNIKNTIWFICVSFVSSLLANEKTLNQRS